MSRNISDSYLRKLERNRKYKNANNENYIDYTKQISILSKDKIIKKYNIFKILDVLKNDIKHYLNNKIVSKWDQNDWKEFNKLKQL